MTAPVVNETAVSPKKNILWLSHNLPYPPIGGVSQRNYNLLRETARSHDVTLVALYQRTLFNRPGALQEALQAFRLFCKRVECTAIEVDPNTWAWWTLVLRSLFSLSPYSVQWLQSKAMERLLQHLLSTNTFDLVHVDTMGLVPYVSFLGGLPRVLNHHNIESHMMRRRIQHEPNFLKKAYFLQEAMKIRSVEKSFCPSFDQNLIVSQLDNLRLGEIVPDLHTTVVANGIDEEYFKPSPHNPIPGSLVMVGGMGWYPNRDAALYFCRKIWPLLVQEMPTVTLTIIGRQPPDEVTALARRDTRVSVLGFVEDIRSIVAGAAIYVCAMRDGGGTRLKILDALAMGKAIVCTRLACEGIDAVPDQHVLVADDPRGFSRQILALLTDIPRRHQLEQNARSLALQYRWTHISTHLNYAYDFAVNRSQKKGEDVVSTQ